MWRVRTVSPLRRQRRRPRLQDGVGALEGVSAVLHQFVSGQAASKQRPDWLISDTPRSRLRLHSAQVFVHLSSLERSVLWSRSVLNARCRICRRKGDADNMLLCDGCDRGHHTHCLRPRLKVQAPRLQLLHRSGTVCPRHFSVTGTILGDLFDSVVGVDWLAELPVQWPLW